MLESSDDDPEAEIDYFSARCKGRDGYEVLWEGGDVRDWLVFRSGETEVDVQDSDQLPPGFFSVSGPKLEWRYRNNNLIGVIFRMTGTDVETGENKDNKLLIIRLTPREGCVLGSAKTNTAARQLLDHATSCGK